MAKKREPDKLDLDMIQCKKDGYGCHYGAWKAAQNRPVVIEKKDVVPEGWKVCPQCGKAFKPTQMGKSRQIYCDIGCQKAAQRMRDREKERERARRNRAKRKEQQNEGSVGFDRAEVRQACCD